MCKSAIIHRLEKIVSILTLYRMRMQRYCDVYKWIFKKKRRQKPNVHIRRHQGSKCARPCISNVIYHKYLHGAAFYTLNGKKTLMPC